jgi:superfamily I DNA/RNA helicase
MFILIGCPIYDRAWILPEWFRCIEQQDIPMDWLGFVFIVSSQDEATNEELITFALKYDHLQTDGISKMIEDAALASDQDSLDGTQNQKEPPKGVRLMTVHASKGLEFPHVFIVGLEQDLFPHHFEGDRKGDTDEEEERRLFYVALTRAEDQIFLSHATIRYIHGEQHIQEPSEFLKDIPEEIVNNEFDTVSFRSSRDDDFFDDGPMEYLVID